MSAFNRRRFLKAAGAGVGTLAASWSASLSRSWSASLSGERLRQPTNSNAEIVVVGAGAFGGWTALYLREMGHSVTLIDQYGPGNSRATSGGESRQIRAGYGEREIYTRWVLEAFERWKAREAEWNRRLFFQTGQITLARAWTKELTDTRKVFDRLAVMRSSASRAAESSTEPLRANCAANVPKMRVRQRRRANIHLPCQGNRHRAICVGCC